MTNPVLSFHNALKLEIMNKLLFFNAIASLFLLLGPTPAKSQPDWSRLDLSGPQAKIKAGSAPEFFLGMQVGIPFSEGASYNADWEEVLQAIYAPEHFENLFGTLGGELMAGNPSGLSTPWISLVGHIRPLIGLQAGVKIRGCFEIRNAVQYYRATWAGGFPVTVVPVEPGPVKSAEGMIEARAEGIVLESGFSIMPGGKNVQPYVSGGIRANIVVEQGSDIHLSGVKIPAAIKPANTAVSPYFGAGIRANILERWYLSAGASVGKVAGRRYLGALEFVAGLRF